MRYPIYFFLILTGFFYLTGKSVDDKTAEQLTTSTSPKGKELIYARKTGARPVATKSTSQTFTVAGNKKSTVVRRDEITQVLTKEAWEKNQPDSGKNKLPANTLRQAALSREANLPEGKWRTSSLQQEQKPDLSTTSNSFGNGVYNSSRRATKKPLDWTVFGNGRKQTSYAPARRIPSKDEVDANKIPVDAIVERARPSKQGRKYRNAKSKRRQLKSRKTARSSRKAKSRKARSRKAKSRKARSRKNRARRYARLKRKNRGAYRIGRRAKPRKARTKNASYKSRRKKFGFSTSGGITSLGGF